jgi:dienelactone hydrolase
MLSLPRLGLAFFTGAIGALAITGPLRALDRISFPSQDGTQVTGWLQKPDGNGPFPAVVALHGCSGLWTKGALNARHADWGDRLQAAGFVVLFPDSLRSRGLESLCNSRDREITPKGRAQDAFGAATWLNAQSFVARGRIGLLGWSNGGSTALHAAGGPLRPAGLDFKAVVALYPGCKVIARNGWSARVPVTILHGTDDDWTPAAPCEQLARAGGANFVAYPGAVHDFDHPNLPLRTRKAAYSQREDGLVTIGTHQPSRDDAIRRVMAIFRRL